MANWVTFGDRPILLDFNRRVERYLDRFMPCEQIPAAPHAATIDERRDSRSRISAYVNLPRFNWPAPPALELNQLYWPTGATRWACGHFLTTAANVLAYRQLTADQPSVPLTFSARTNGRNFIAPLHVHSYRQFGDSSEKLYIMTLVDDRYFWQNKAVDVSMPADVSAWNLVQTSLATALGIPGTSTVTFDDVPADYVEPDVNEWNIGAGNAAVLLDAYAASVGMRVVRAANGDVRVMSPATATAVGVLNYLIPRRVVLGGTVTNHAPADQVRVTFPKLFDEKPDCAGSVYEKIENQELPAVSAAQHNVHSTHFAVYDDADDSTLNNEATVHALAAQIAADYWAWGNGPAFDIVYSGIQPQALTGFHDCLIYTFGRERETETSVEAIEGQPTKLIERHHRVVTTRAISLPPNVEATHQLSQSKTVNTTATPTEQWTPCYNEPRKPLVRFTLDAELLATDASVAATITDQYGPGLAHDDLSITVHNLLTSTPATYHYFGDEDDAGQAVWDEGQNFRIVDMECATQ